MRAGIVFALLALSHGAAGAQAASHGFSDRLSAASRAALERIADSARAAGLPTQPLVSKAAEGLLKGADEARIVSAVRALSRHLGEARVVLGGGAGTATLMAAADAIRAGIPTTSIRQIAAASVRRPEPDLGLALVTVTDLAASGVPPARAERAVTTLLRSGTPERDLPALRAAIAHDIASGVAPEAALDARLKRIVRDPGGEAGAPRLP